MKKKRCHYNLSYIFIPSHREKSKLIAENIFIQLFITISRFTPLWICWNICVFQWGCPSRLNKDVLCIKDQMKDNKADTDFRHTSYTNRVVLHACFVPKFIFSLLWKIMAYTKFDSTVIPGDSAGGNLNRCMKLKQSIGWRLKHKSTR